MDETKELLWLLSERIAEELGPVKELGYLSPEQTIALSDRIEVLMYESFMLGKKEATK